MDIDYRPLLFGVLSGLSICLFIMLRNRQVYRLRRPVLYTNISYLEVSIVFGP